MHSGKNILDPTSSIVFELRQNNYKLSFLL